MAPLLLSLWASGVRLDAGSDTSNIFYVTAAAASVPLLVGGAIAHARTIASPVRKVRSTGTADARAMIFYRASIPSFRLRSARIP